MRDPNVSFGLRVAHVISLTVACWFFTIPDAPAADSFQAGLRPILEKYCLGCHSTKKHKGDLDLERFKTEADVRREPKTWQKVVYQLDLGEMPPEEKPQPDAVERKQILDWIGKALKAEALARAGDPGLVVLRRLSNAEYTYTIQDLTGVDLNPAHEFPIDGAAGEGFMNVGNALVMSPGLFSKYLDAAKEIAAHAVLLPDGFRFSLGKSRRDWTDEILHEIRSIHFRHTSSRRDMNHLNRWNPSLAASATNEDGRVDLAQYISALVRHRERLLNDIKSVEAIAGEEHLNEKYLRLLATMLVSGKPSSVLLDQTRNRWQTAKPEEATEIAGNIRALQDRVWQFNKVGHFGSTRPWQTPAEVLLDQVAFKLPIKPAEQQEEVVFYLVTGDAGDGREGDQAVWRKPRIEFKGREPILLRDLRYLSWLIETGIDKELARTDLYLGAVIDLATNPNVDEVAAVDDLKPSLLRRWSEYLSLTQLSVEPRLTGLFKNKVSKVAGYEDLNGWRNKDLPSMFSNASDKTVSFLTLEVPPRSVNVHPNPDEDVAVAWRSPMDGRVLIHGKAADADSKCGNGAAWSLELLSNTGNAALASGAFDNGRSESFKIPQSVEVRKGDFISLVISARNRDHSCDNTHIDLTLSEDKEDGLVWNLSDIIDNIHAGNPREDNHGNADVWHFYERASQQAKKSITIALGSALALWRSAALKSELIEELDTLAAAVKAAILAEEAARSVADKEMVRTLRALEGPLKWAEDASLSSEPKPDKENAQSHFGLANEMFGRLPDTGKDSLSVEAPSVIEVRLPAALVRDGQFVVDGTLIQNESDQASVQMQVSQQKPAGADGLILGEPIVVRPGSAARQRFAAALDDFRNLFPSAMCYSRIVPVDEVVTLVLFHREDEYLSRLMLDEKDRARLDRLWEELHYASQDAFTIVDALEQLLEYATQDGDPSVIQPLEKPFRERADAFRKQLVDTQPAHLESLIEFAARVWRRPLAAEETQKLRALYDQLRADDLSHEEAFRLTLARVLTAPAFLYRIEKAGPGKNPSPVSDAELASRLSYFLWSSMPDAELASTVAEGRTHEPGTLLAHTRRLLSDSRIRRLAIEFACQWLHVRGFDEFDEKSERHFAQFTQLRNAMYEESIRFFMDLFQNDRSVLSILDADHTFLNEPLAKHYGIQGVRGPDWQQVSNLKQHGRGGFLTQATFLSRQSGASRTSPILRGNWISETLLGERLPRPPANVPQLPEDEAKEELSIRQLVEKHTQDPACMKCHKRIDPYGFTLEKYDAIGRLRDKDLGGRPIDTNTTLMNGKKIDGVDGLRKYLLTERLDDFLKQFCRKILGYALGRETELSDEPLLQKMISDLKANEYRVSIAVELIVSSKQFQQIRGKEMK